MVKKFNPLLFKNQLSYFFLWIFLWYLSTSFVKIQIQPQGKPREQHLGEVKERRNWNLIWTPISLFIHQIRRSFNCRHRIHSVIGWRGQKNVIIAAILFFNAGKEQKERERTIKHLTLLSYSDRYISAWSCVPRIWSCVSRIWSYVPRAWSDSKTCSTSATILAWILQVVVKKQ